MSDPSIQSSTDHSGDSQPVLSLPLPSSESTYASDESIKSNGNKPERKDAFCWVCHKDKCNRSCKLCQRSFHSRCLTSDTGKLAIDGDSDNKPTLICPDCTTLMKYEDLKNRPSTLKDMSPYQFSHLLMYALGTIKNVRVFFPPK